MQKGLPKIKLLKRRQQKMRKQLRFQQLPLSKKGSVSLLKRKLLLMKKQDWLRKRPNERQFQKWRKQRLKEPGKMRQMQTPRSNLNKIKYRVWLPRQASMTRKRSLVKRLPPIRWLLNLILPTMRSYSGMAGLNSRVEIPVMAWLR